MQFCPIIGFAGKAGSGKDTAANFFIANAKEQLSHIKFYVYYFAKPIYTMLDAVHLLPKSIDVVREERAVKESINPTFGVSPRYMLQTLGTEWGRNLIHPDLWVLLADDELKRHGSVMVITDIRFQNEVKFVKQHGGKIIYIDRPGRFVKGKWEVSILTMIKSIFSRKHASEKQMSYLKKNADYIICSNNLSNLESAVQQIIKKIYQINAS